MRKKLIFILALSILISLQLSLITFARAGGGGSGGSGGGSSSGSSNSGYVGDTDYYGDPAENIIGSILFFLFPLISIGLTKKDEILFRFEVLNKTKDTKGITKKITKIRLFIF